jgi:hypothetical protein
MKPGLFSFIGDEFENVFHYSDLFLPGIEKIAGIYYSQRDRRIRILSRRREEEIEDGFEDVLQTRENLVMIQKFRAEHQPYSWIKKDDLPFEISEPKMLSTPNLFTELENVILVLRYENAADRLYDLLMIYFNKNLGNFGPNRSDKILSTDNKAIIGNLLYYQFKSFFKLNADNRKLLSTLNNNVRSVINENLSLKDLLDQIQSGYGENMVNMAQLQLKNLSEKFGRKYEMTEETLNKIRGFRGNLKHLPVILENAVIFTENLLMLNDEETIKIQPYSIDFESYQVVDKTEPFTKKIDSRLSRAMQLLDKLERAASILKGRNIALIGSKIGEAMEPPISAPAITESLGKSREMLRQLLGKYPDKWEIIRSEFRPLINQLRKDEPKEIKEESA